jgi:hypothetical protein
MPITPAGKCVAFKTRVKVNTVDIPATIEKSERVPRASLPRPAESLRPTLKTMDRAILGSRRARAIIEAWQFRINPKEVSYREVSEQEWEAIQRG